jgi:hypothetical protein
MQGFRRGEAARDHTAKQLKGASRVSIPLGAGADSTSESGARVSRKRMRVQPRPSSCGMGRAPTATRPANHVLVFE